MAAARTAATGRRAGGDRNDEDAPAKALTRLAAADPAVRIRNQRGHPSLDAMTCPSAREPSMTEPDLPEPTTGVTTPPQGRHRASRNPPPASAGTSASAETSASAVPSWLPRAALGGAVALAVGLGVLASASAASTPTRQRAESTASPAVTSVTSSLARLSRGAPKGAKLLQAKPVHVSRPAPATPAAISGLSANGIPAVALNAYRLAAARLASAQPSCGIAWWLLAGIGRVESNHGRFGGATLSVTGESRPHIIGGALDGTVYDYIADTDGGRLDADSRFDHAVGPMQFIPSTWAGYGIDGNGDGIADPFNINDAALAAARYLCAAGGDLRTAAGQDRAVLAYNHSDEYLALVLGTARAYATGTPLDAPIHGGSTGVLPPVATSWLPPVNPGAPVGFATGAGSRPAAGTTGSSGTGSSGMGWSGTGSSGTGSAGSGSPGSGSSGTGSAGSGSPGSGSSGSGSSGSGSSGSGSTGTGSTGSAPAPSKPASALPPGPVSAPTSRPAVPLPSVPVPVPTGTGGALVCTVTNLLGNLIQVPCPH